MFNPWLVLYLICLPVVSEANVRLRLAEEDAKAIELGSREVVHENVLPSMLIYQGLEFEDLQ